MKHLTHVASRFVNCPLMIHPPKLEVIIKALAPAAGYRSGRRAGAAAYPWTPRPR